MTIHDTIEELKRLHTYANPAPWGEDDEDPTSIWFEDGQSNIAIGMDYRDVEFVIALRNAFGDLVSEIERLEKENEELKQKYES